MAPSKVVDGATVALVAEMFGIEDEDEIDSIAEAVVEILGMDDTNESGNEMAELITNLSPRQLVLAGAVAGVVVRGWLLEEKEGEEEVEGYV